MKTDADSTCQTKVLPPRLVLGQSLKQFHLESVLGEGGMGVVYRAQDTQLCRPVALKVLPSALTSDPERKQRFLQEARAAARINHPAIAQIFSVDEEKGITFIVMELVEGKTLRDLIAGQQLDVLGALDIAIQIAEGLAKAHDLGIVHRDIKPANVMVTADSRVKILDFGLAKWLDSDLGLGSIPAGKPDSSPVVTTLPGVVMGTAAYMSPEQVRGAAVDGRADIFSLGILLFEMATGRSPFRRDNFLDSLHAVAFDETPPLGSINAHLPGELQRIAVRCLRKQPEERYANAHQLAQELRVLRRQMESGQMPKTSWRVRATEAWERFRQQPPSQYLWLAGGLAAVALVVYLLSARVSLPGLLAPTIVALYVYRLVRTRPHRMQDAFVRRTARIPEVLLIVQQDRQFTVVVERPAAQLYSRINQQLRGCNRKLYFGSPMTVAVLHDLPAEKTKQLLATAGVQYVREDVLGKN